MIQVSEAHDYIRRLFWDGPFDIKGGWYSLKSVSLQQLKKMSSEALKNFIFRFWKIYETHISRIKSFFSIQGDASFTSFYFKV